MPATPLVSAIVPVLADRDTVGQLIPQIPLDLRVEIVVAEAGTEPWPEALARDECLLFLHADSQLRSGWLDLFQCSGGS